MFHWFIIDEITTPIGSRLRARIAASVTVKGTNSTGLREQARAFGCLRGGKQCVTFDVAPRPIDEARRLADRGFAADTQLAALDHRVGGVCNAAPLIGTALVAAATTYRGGL
jgi:hypothetical protein